jgi:hydrogenase nickel incorporation protein HypA/HybF
VHERSLIADLMRKIAAIAREESARKVISVKVQLGALCHLSAPHLREHFAQAAGGTVAEGARLDIEVLTDVTDPHAQEILLDSLEVETDP